MSAGIGKHSGRSPGPRREHLHCGPAADIPYCKACPGSELPILRKPPSGLRDIRQSTDDRRHSRLPADRTLLVLKGSRNGTTFEGNNSLKYRKVGTRVRRNPIPAEIV